MEYHVPGQGTGGGVGSRGIYALEAGRKLLLEKPLAGDQKHMLFHILESKV